VTLRARLKPLAPGLTPRAVLDKMAAVQMLDVHFPITDGRTLVLSRLPSSIPIRSCWSSSSTSRFLRSLRRASPHPPIALQSSSVVETWGVPLVILSIFFRE
jgi:hypothetical protein